MAETMRLLIIQVEFNIVSDSQHSPSAARERDSDRDRAATQRERDTQRDGALSKSLIQNSFFWIRMFILSLLKLETSVGS